MNYSIGFYCFFLISKLTTVDIKTKAPFLEQIWCTERISTSPNESYTKLSPCPAWCFVLSWSNCYKLHKLPPTNILVQNSLGSLESISFLKFYLHPSHLHEGTCGCDGYVCSLVVVMAQRVCQNLSDFTL